MSDLWRRILEPAALSTVFQPVVELDTESPRAHLFECLTRGPAGTNLESAGVLFEFARRKGRESELDRLCIEAAMLAARELPPSARLSLNVHLGTLDTDRGFPALLAATAEQSGIDLRRLTLEIIEHAPTWIAGQMMRNLAILRSYGVCIALDDVGAGHASFRAMLDCAPDYLKVDRRLIAGCDRNPRQRAVIEALALAASRLGARVIAEGVESAGEVNAIRDLAVDLAQGYHFSPPAAARDLQCWFRELSPTA